MNWQKLIPVAWMLAGAVILTGGAKLLTSNPQIVAYGVSEYCAQVEPDVRADLREAVNQAASPHSVHIRCDD